MFAGIGGEVLYRPFHQNFAIGAELWRVKQREYNMMFRFLDYQTTTGHINFYYREPRSQILLTLRGGRFLAQDSGLNFDFSRRFPSGVIIGAFFLSQILVRRNLVKEVLIKVFIFMFQ